jgi:hypothetical protein
MPGNTRPEVARAAKRQKKAEAKAPARAAEVGTLRDVKAVLWRAVVRVEALTADADKGVQLRAVSALVQACQAFVKVLEVGEVEARLNELEAQLNGAKSSGDGAATRRLPTLGRNGGRGYADDYERLNRDD